MDENILDRLPSEHPKKVGEIKSKKIWKQQPSFSKKLVER